MQIYEPGEGDPMAPPDDMPPTGEDGEALPEKPGADETIVDGPPDIGLPPAGGKTKKVYVDGISATIIAERVEYRDENGKLVTESLRDFTKAALEKRFASLDDFLKRWKAAERKQAIIEELEAEGLPFDPIGEELGKDLDPFDLICHVAFDRRPLTRRERAENVKKRDVFTKYGPQALAVRGKLVPQAINSLSSWPARDMLNGWSTETTIGTVPNSSTACRQPSMDLREQQSCGTEICPTRR